MSVVQVSCIDQVLSFTNTPVIASGGVNEDKIEFNFCSLWDGYSKVAVIYQNKGEIYYSLVDENNQAIIPSEVIATKGTMFLGVMGVNGSTTRTSNVLRFKIENGALDGTTPPEPTAELYQQVLTLSQQMIDTAEELTTAEEEFETEVRQRLASVYTYKGSVATVADLPSNATIGDVYNVVANEINYAWTGTLWDALGGSFDVSQYYTKAETDTALVLKANQATTYTKTEVNTALELKANVTNVYSKTEIDTKLTHKPDIYTGTTDPTAETGVDGDIYIKYTVAVGE